MKRYMPFLFVFVSFIIFNVHSVSASNCAAGELFNTSTGQSCGGATVHTACNAGDLFNSTTGQPCANTSSGGAGSGSSSSTTTDSSVTATFSSLFKSNFKVGLSSNDVKPLQQFLKDQGYYFGNVDGKYGRITARAVSDFQGDNNISTTFKEPLNSTTNPGQNGGGGGGASLIFPVTILSPKEEETYKAGDVMNISWKVNKDVGSNDSFVVTVSPQWRYATTKDDQYMLSTPVLNSDVRSYSWTIPDPLPAHDPFPFRVNVGFCQQSPSGTKQVLVDGAYSSCLNMYGDTVFNVNIVSSQGTTDVVSSQSSITITSPNGGETWQAGGVGGVKYSSQGLTGFTLAEAVINQDTLKQYPVASGTKVTQDGHDGDAFSIPTDIPAGKYKLLLEASLPNCISGQQTCNVQIRSDQSDAPFTITSNSTLPSITVLSPNGGENLALNSQATIKWNAAAGTRVSGFLYNANASSNDYTYWVLFDGVTSVPGDSSYKWNVGQATPANGMVGMPGAGTYKLQICQSPDAQASHFSNCHYSNGSFIISGSSVSQTPIIPPVVPDATVSASLLDTKEDHAGQWGVFGPGSGGHGSSDDWNFKAVVNFPTAKSIKYMTILHNRYGEGWTTTKSETSLGGPLYPLVVFQNGTQLNSVYDQTLGSYTPGTYEFRLFGQRESTSFTGGTLYVGFTDGTTATTFIQPAQPVVVTLDPLKGTNESFGSKKDTPVSILVEKFTAKAKEVNKVPITISSIGPSSEKGGKVEIQSGSIVYTPPVGYIGSDSFTFVITDGNGRFGTSKATTNILDNVKQPTTYTSKTTLINGHMLVTFINVPSSVFTIETSIDKVNWVMAGKVVSDSQGKFTFEDSAPATPENFYHIEYVSQVATTSTTN